jgi:hypothetical protein
VHAALVFGRIERERHAQRARQRKGIVERTGVDAGEIDRTMARHLQRLGFATELAAVVHAHAQASTGLALERFADPAHRRDRRVVLRMHVGRGEHARRAAVAGQRVGRTGHAQRAQTGQQPATAGVGRGKRANRGCPS